MKRCKGEAQAVLAIETRRSVQRRCTFVFQTYSLRSLCLRFVVLLVCDGHVKRRNVFNEVVKFGSVIFNPLTHPLTHSHNQTLTLQCPHTPKLRSRG